MARQRKSKNELNDNEKRFVDEYIIHFNATRAYQAVFPDTSYEACKTGGYKWVTKAHIREAVAKAQKAEYKRRAITREKLLNRLDTIAFNDDEAEKKDIIKAVHLMSKIEKFIDNNKDLLKEHVQQMNPGDGLEISITREIVEK